MLNVQHPDTWERTNVYLTYGLRFKLLYVVNGLILQKL